MIEIFVVLLLLFFVVAALVSFSFRLFRYLFMSNASEATNSTEKPTGLLEGPGHALTRRCLLVAGLTVLMLIPLTMLSGLISERNYLYQDVLSDIASTWGGEQTLTGPILVVPFVERHTHSETSRGQDGKMNTRTTERFVQKQAISLPKSLDVDTELLEEHRQRGIYNSLVYKAELAIDGHFELPDIEYLSAHVHEVFWDKAYVVIGVADSSAINEVAGFSWNDSTVVFEPGTERFKALGSGFHAKLGDLKGSEEALSFSTTMTLNGSGSYSIAPLGETTNIALRSSWPHPSFRGSVLPDSHTTDAEGFTANWSIPHLARNFAQSWVDGESEYVLTEFTAGVALFEPVFLYTQVTRAAKYGFLFIGLTFLAYLIFETTTGVKLHIVQYALIGISMAMFYLVLLSFAEHIQFLSAYLLAAGVNIGLITLYTYAVLRHAGRSAMIAFMLSALYLVLYSILQLEDYALLMGTLMLTAVLAVLMYVTRNLTQREQGDIGAQVGHGA